MKFSAFFRVPNMFESPWERHFFLLIRAFVPVSQTSRATPFKISSLFLHLSQLSREIWREIMSWFLSLRTPPPHARISPLVLLLTIALILWSIALLREAWYTPRYWHITHWRGNVWRFQRGREVRLVEMLNQDGAEIQRRIAELNQRKVRVPK